MREFSTSLSEALVNGLKPNESRSDVAFFSELYNLVPYRLSLRSYEKYTNPVLADTLYPFPQWFSFLRDNILVTKDRVFRLDDSFFPFDQELAFSFDNNLESVLRGVDYGKSWILINPEGCLYSREDVIAWSSELSANTIFQYKNRTFIGGPQQGLWTATWIEFVEGLDISADMKTGLTTPLGENFIFWSSFDSRDFPFALLEPTSQLFSEYAEQQLNEMVFGNEWGFMEMPFSGAVLDMFQIGQQLIVFGENGLALLDYRDGGTLGIGAFKNISIKQRGAVGGDTDGLVFIDKYDQLWKISSQGINKLDFKAYMKNLTDHIFITKVVGEDTYMIGDGTYSYILVDNKLAEINQTVHDIYTDYPGLVGITHETGDDNFYFTTDNIDIGVPSLKTLTGIFLSFNEYVEASSFGTAESGGRRVTGPTMILNQEGYAALRLFGKNHQIKVLGYPQEDKKVVLDRVEFKWQIDDTRQTRGIFATENASGNGG